MDFDRGPNMLTLILIGAGAFVVLLFGCCCSAALIPFIAKGPHPRGR